MRIRALICKDGEAYAVNHPLRLSHSVLGGVIDSIEDSGGGVFKIRASVKTLDRNSSFAVLVAADDVHLVSFFPQVKEVAQ